jgi:succinate dehydrogenase/fumarate reductase flavoprotein subunit
MIRISAIEKALPDDVRKTARSHPFVTIAAGALVGYYLGRNHGRTILSALVAFGLSAGTSTARKMLGVESPPRLARVR